MQCLQPLTMAAKLSMGLAPSQGCAFIRMSVYILEAGQNRERCSRLVKHGAGAAVAGRWRDFESASMSAAGLPSWRFRGVKEKGEVPHVLS